MQPDLITYRKFNDAGLADDLAATLHEHGIEYSIEEEFMSFNPTFYDDASSKEFAVKISAGDFARVNKIRRLSMVLLQVMKFMRTGAGRWNQEH